ncbi:MAG: valine--tRNA ligase [Candidatus Taylorbacteria bacterium RIFCSPHIGHO2_02_FULL_45_28]|uniref:Valine--tRNA ligase n=1 Tax=Candidatus Taylorbacteria bacterium RIFCSPHIGHO2_12_FULL_45_16 TaxID=1802315 RepID=A0A1G2MZL0_9BACT|nr:MAG: valine--tRNA ligase [Candidatus Taylorbacteria bacterium RIFCSPHIGHO2_01_FULL_44_110]OHA25608.1 MAG: valine--tRNA ligase [Candidatus Taylorbacteria bacterium RIFCSPHIGHO2_02_FULL_45_28]OHA29274.1 MAG: valine--tRNA ligase [Candidatus Taylorbacteria bacterium RIFCSPHIGHO2_12_FULL_45_16]OHA33496.1 MAG: valine--tRNA ligase [Candidatus Taylorbacteria bacterium RIFCSPLOWO2_01_FULL_45_59]OHA38367.1 MAG: valine--tRNA ligase [Candidatus Taylorbacteria bacterium RIFCSPLOWO2_02_FULL_45_10b]
MHKKFLKPYDSTSTEDRIYRLWKESGFFNPDKLPARNQAGEPFSIVLPPPNVTGTLHMGHAAMLAIEDIMIRYKRMQGFKTLWLPGTDHAAIATQSKVEKDIEKKEGKRRHDLGREELLKRVDAFAKASHDTIVSQVRKMGASIDWSREAFTLDEERNLAVRTAFKTMYDLGLIYRGHRIVNWDPKGQTTISDDEIVYEERKAKFYTFRYSKDFPISIATTRPETKVGDVAVAVHPDDVRYKKYVGQSFEVDFSGAKLNIKVIADTAVDPEFGTGAVGVTPAHSGIDADIASRHGLPTIQVIDEFAKMTPNTGLVAGMKVGPARETIVKWLEDNSLLEKTEDIVQNIATAERTGGVIEPLPKLQWFIGVNKPFRIPHSVIPGIKSGDEVTLKEIMKKAVESGAIKIIPERFERVYFHWIDNLRDWCISRQIWYGHRIPVWYKEKDIFVGIEAPKGEGWTQDEDTLDTWFSSGLWTFSTLGWPGKTKDLETFHPTNVLETGYDILFFWVARMVLMTGCLLGDIPFKTVYLHGLVRDTKGRKMSKSLDNIIDPLDMIKKYGADATRLSLIIGTGPGNDSKSSEDKVKGYKNFSNKIWNIARFIIGMAEGERVKMVAGEKPEILEVEAINYDPTFKAWTPADLAHMKRLEELTAEVTGEMDEYKFYLVGEKLYHYVWHELADKILEESKPIISGNDSVATVSRIQFLLHSLKTILKLLHPFMPYVTEEIWSDAGFADSKNLNKDGKGLLMVEGWPE